MGAFVIASQFLGKEAALLTYVPSFFLSSLGGTVIAAILVPALKKAGADRFFRDTKQTDQSGAAAPAIPEQKE